MFDQMNFEDFQFEIIDIEIAGTPDMHITQNGITFTRRLIEDMGYPQYVQPMVDIKNKVFALKACKAESERAIRFSKPKGEQKKALSTSNNTIRYMLRNIMKDEWKEENRYHITGKWFADAKAMIFNLNSAKELPPFSVHRKNDITQK
ncbi:hypothetical protein [Alkaliphilus sp. B6464]|uniref:hypothetical protein n=1 Tax=Alkaliphilus sp. B6464 TaxID=2731219 RepID=UPI001BADCB58|nr:hypothetical protein [Alkaliphilus sp. B6464]QUH18539.1 hypothetical protein HYG84_00550 [Alkaliphilus sp. B6464]